MSDDICLMFTNALRESDPIKTLPGLLPSTQFSGSRIAVFFPVYTDKCSFVRH